MGFCLICTVILQGQEACKWHESGGHRGEMSINDVGYFVSHLVPKPKA